MVPDMKKILTILLLIPLLLCSCSHGRAIDSSYFTSVMEGKGFSVEDHTEYLDPSLPESRDAERIKAYGAFFVCYDKYADSEKAENIFDVWVNYYDSWEDCEDDCDVQYKSGRYLQVCYTDYDGQEKLFILSRVENTTIQITATLPFSDSAAELLEELGYGK